jgi:hypothetical protein
MTAEAPPYPRCLASEALLVAWGVDPEFCRAFTCTHTGGQNPTLQVTVYRLDDNGRPVVDYEAHDFVFDEVTYVWPETGPYRPKEG